MSPLAPALELMHRPGSLKRVLLISANPRGTEPLSIQAEERLIREQLRLAGLSDLPIFSCGATRPRDLQQALLEAKPQIVHFTGHGDSDGLAFEDDSGGLRIIRGDALGNLFQILASRYSIECVLINARFSGFDADDILPYVEYVIEMSTDITQEDSLEFIVGFYKALAAGETYEFAYDLGCNAIRLAGGSPGSAPVLRSNPIYASGASSLGGVRAGNVLIDPLYRELRSVLDAGQWRQSDLLTNQLMLRVVDREETDWVRHHELENFPCSALTTIDQLWMDASDGRFGFSAQQGIWRSLGGLGTHPRPDGDMERVFGDRVGWRRREVWLGYDEYRFDASAEPGHLPRWVYNHASGWWLGRSCLVCTRLEACELMNH